NGYGKRTALSDYPRKSRGTMGVKTITLTENKGALAGALVVREHEELLFISAGGMVQRTPVRGINRYGRASQGVRLMNLKDDDTVSAVALVAESDEEVAAASPPPPGNGAQPGDPVGELPDGVAGNPEGGLVDDPDGAADDPDGAADDPHGAADDPHGE
ncbi:MAG: DNA gyrase C-terminal beta-propeller domain-containing protein, partial [Solirubrobacteraceae bacterium]